MPLIFGAITVVAGIVGVALGSWSANRLRRRAPNADPLVCAFGLLASTPFLYLSLCLARTNVYITWVSAMLSQ